MRRTVLEEETQSQVVRTALSVASTVYGSALSQVPNGCGIITSRFKSKYMFAAERKTKSDRIRQKYPTKIPVIIESGAITLKDIRFGMPIVIERGTSIAQLQRFVRDQLGIRGYEAIYLFVANKVIASGTSTLGSLDQIYCDSDGFLYIKYISENVFG